MSTGQEAAEAVINEESNVLNLKYDDSYFDRTIVTCLLVHLFEPEKAIEEILRVTRDSGYVTIYSPCEPGFLLGLAQKLITERKMKRLGILNPRFLHFVEHRGNFLALDFFIKNIFEGSQVQKKFYPFHLPFMNFNLYCIYQIKVKKVT